MKGRDTFTRREADQIKEHLRMLRRPTTPGSEHLPIRNGLRAHGFYIRDWKVGMTADDFCDLVRSGEIRIRNG